MLNVWCSHEQLPFQNFIQFCILIWIGMVEGNHCMEAACHCFYGMRLHGSYFCKWSSHPPPTTNSTLQKATMVKFIQIPYITKLTKDQLEAIQSVWLFRMKLLRWLVLPGRCLCMHCCSTWSALISTIFITWWIIFGWMPLPNWCKTRYTFCWLSFWRRLFVLNFCLHLWLLWMNGGISPRERFHVVELYLRIADSANLIYRHSGAHWSVFQCLSFKCFLGWL